MLKVMLAAVIPLTTTVAAASDEPPTPQEVAAQFQKVRTAMRTTPEWFSLVADVAHYMNADLEAATTPPVPNAAFAGVFGFAAATADAAARAVDYAAPFGTLTTACPLGGSIAYSGMPGATYRLKIQFIGCQVDTGALVRSDGPMIVRVRTHDSAQSKFVSLRFGNEVEPFRQTTTYYSVPSLTSFATFDYTIVGSTVRRDPDGALNGPFDIVVDGTLEFDDPSLFANDPAVRRSVSRYTVDDLRVKGAWAVDAAFGYTNVDARYQRGSIAGESFLDGVPQFGNRFEYKNFFISKTSTPDGNVSAVSGQVSRQYLAGAEAACRDGEVRIKTLASLIDDGDAFLSGSVRLDGGALVAFDAQGTVPVSVRIPGVGEFQYADYTEFAIASECFQ